MVACGARWLAGRPDDLTSRDGWDLENEESDRQIVDQLPIVIACDDDDPARHGHLHPVRREVPGGR